MKGVITGATAEIKKMIKKHSESFASINLKMQKKITY